MMLAKGVEGDILLHYHLVVIYMEAFGKMYACVLIHASCDLLIHPGDPVRSLQKSFSFSILANSLQD